MDPLNVKLPPAAIQAIEQGRLIEAIKITREQTGVGLKESKDLVDSYLAAHPEARQQGRVEPVKHTSTPKTKAATNHLPILGILGIGCLVGGAWTYQSTSAFLSGSTKAAGVVVGLQASRRNSSYAPIVEFIDRNGEKVRFTSSVSSYPPSFEVGQKVEVFYRPNQPQQAQINDFVSLWLLSLILTSLGGVFALIGAIPFLGRLGPAQKSRH